MTEHAGGRGIMKRLLFFAIPIVLALCVLGAGVVMLKQNRAFDSAKLRGNNELCNVHIYSLNQQLARNNRERYANPIL
jgi:hypothetical protein